MFIDHRFDYMPKGSYCIGADIRHRFPTDADVREIGNGGVVYFLKDILESLKERFMEDVKKEYHVV